MIVLTYKSYPEQDTCQPCADLVLAMFQTTTLKPQQDNKANSSFRDFKCFREFILFFFLFKEHQ